MNENIEYGWKPGTQFRVKAEVAADTIRRLQQTLGKDDVTAKELLDDSRREDSPLHSCFTWDDTIAAEKWRLEEARHIISSITFKKIKDEKPSAPLRLFLNVAPVAPRNQGKFIGIDIILKNPDYKKQALLNMMNELRNVQRKYDMYEEFSGVSKAIDDLGDALQ